MQNRASLSFHFETGRDGNVKRSRPVEVAPDATAGCRVELKGLSPEAAQKALTDCLTAYREWVTGNYELQRNKHLYR